jgi:hypothetical protein
MCGVSTVFRKEDWKTPGRAGEVRMGVILGSIVAVDVEVDPGVRVAAAVSVGTGPAVAWEHAARLIASNAKLLRKRPAKCGWEAMPRILHYKGK